MKRDNCPAVDSGEGVGDDVVVESDFVQVLDDCAGSLKAMVAGSL